MAQLKNTTVSDTGFLQLPVGTTGQRPTPAAGQMRFNTSTGKAEFYDAGLADWVGTAGAGVVATGGNSVYDIDVEGTTYRVHVFTTTGNSTFTVAKGGSVEYLIVAGGGSGGSGEGNPAGDSPGGGGAGGLLTGFTTVTPQNYTITVGAGASIRVTGTSQNGSNGANSSAFGLTAIGGGGGGREEGPGSAGGSGGGGGGSCTTGRKAGGSGTSGQGNAGGTGGDSGCTRRAGAGGGGAGNNGGDDRGNVGGIGGNGIALNITGVNVFYAGGGGGGNAANTGGAAGSGGLGGGGAGGTSPSGPGTDAMPNTGGGGGATGSGTSTINGLGGSGIVIIRYPLRQANPVVAAGKVIGDGLVLDLDFAKPTVYTGAGATVADSRLNGLTGTLANGTRTINTRTHRAGLFFDGSDDRLNTSLRKSFNEVLTVECWYRGTKTSRNHLWNFTGNNLHCNFNDGTYPLWMYWNGSGGNRVRYNGNFTDGTIKHLVFTHSGSTNKVYLNGAELPIAESGGTQTFSNIGGSGFNVGDNAFGGDIYILKVYEKELSAAEVLQNFNATRWRFGV